MTSLALHSVVYIMHVHVDGDSYACTYYLCLALLPLYHSVLCIVQLKVKQK